MDEKTKRIIGDVICPFPINDDSAEGPAKVFAGQGMFVISANGIDIPKGSHAHSSYEFVMPLSHMQYTSIQNKPARFEINQLTPINPEQQHGQLNEVTNCRLMTFQINKDLFNDISYSIFKKSDITFNNESICIGNEIFALLNLFKEEIKNLQADSDFALQNIVNLVIINLIRQLKSDAPKLISEKKYCERDNINRSIEYLQEEYNKNFSLEEVARIANLSPYHFIRTFKALTGKTPYAYLLDVKIEKAKELLKLNGYTVTDVCFRCGFNNLEHFSSVFKRKLGMLPSQYRKLIK